MNIKYVSILSFFVVVAVNAAKLPVTDRLDQAKRAYIECHASTWGSITNCYDQKMEFGEAKHEFLRPHFEKARPFLTNTVGLQLEIDLKTAWFFQRDSIRCKYRKIFLEAQGHFWITQALQPERIMFDEKGNAFLADNRSIVEFSEYLLNQYYPDHNTEKKSTLHDILTNPYYKSEVEEAREKVMAVIREQAQPSE